MNKKQRTSVAISIAIILISVAVWLAYGGEIFTKTQIMIEKKDELFGFTTKVWQNKFVWGLDLTMLISGISAVTGGILYFVFRKKKDTLET